MTAPIIIQRQGLGQAAQQAFSPLLDALAKRQQLGLQQQSLEIERQKAEAQIAQAGAATAESKGRTKKLLAELEQQGIQLRANDLAAERLISLISGPGGITPETTAAAREEIIRKGDKEISSEALVAFDALIAANTEQQQRQALADQATVEAEVAVRTAEDRVRAGQLVDELAQTEIERNQAATAASEAATEASQLDSRLTELLIENDPDRVDTARVLWQTGNVTWGEARKTAGVKEGGIPDEEVFDPTAASASAGAGGEAARKAATFGRIMQTAGGLINTLEESTGGITALASLQRQTKFAPLDIVINRFLSPEQQQLVNAHRQFGDAFRFFVSGQQSSDREALRILNSVAGQAGDSPETLRQKRFMRNVMTRMALDAAAGIVSPAEAMDEIIDQARLQNMPAGAMKVFSEQRADAVRLERERAAGRGPLILNPDPTTADSLAGSTATIDSLINNRFNIR